MNLVILKLYFAGSVNIFMQKYVRPILFMYINQIAAIPNSAHYLIICPGIYRTHFISQGCLRPRPVSHF